MKMLTEAEYAELALRAGGEAPDIEAAAQLLVDLADRRGLVLTIEQRPLTPLAMGHFETVVAVRQARRSS
jgi:hypothetical protein